MRVNFWIPRWLVLIGEIALVIFLLGPAIYAWATGDFVNAISFTLGMIFFAACFVETLTKSKGRR